MKWSGRYSTYSVRETAAFTTICPTPRECSASCSKGRHGLNRSIYASVEREDRRLSMRSMRLLFFVGFIGAAAHWSSGCGGGDESTGAGGMTGGEVSSSRSSHSSSHSVVTSTGNGGGGDSIGAPCMTDADCAGATCSK